MKNVLRAFWKALPSKKIPAGTWLGSAALGSLNTAPKDVVLYWCNGFFSWRLRFGDVDLSSRADDEDDFVQEVRITKITKHPKYVEGVAYFDIAVLIIEPIEYTGYVRPVCLPSSKDFRVDEYDRVSKINYSLNLT